MTYITDNDGNGNLVDTIGANTSVGLGRENVIAVAAGGKSETEAEAMERASAGSPAPSEATINGGPGDDVYYIHNSQDVVVEAANAGHDTIFTSVSYGLAAGSHVEVLSTIDHSSTIAIDLSGNEFANTLYGNAGNNVLNGRGGADILIGLGGNDTYYLDDAGDFIVEGAGQGQDTAFTSVSYTLGGDAQIEVLSTIDHGATTAINLTGNGFGNTIYGNAGANILNGGGGADFLIGLGGNDIYYVDNAADYIVEGGDQGNDTLFTSVNYTLTGDAHVEVLSTIDHASLAALSLTGNQFANTLYGNAGANTLNGGGGADFLIGFGGNDIYYVDNAADYIVEAAGQGNDTLFTSVNYTLTGDAHVEVLSTIDHTSLAGLSLTGNQFANTIYGNYGFNTLNGGAGADLMIGFYGEDTYYVDDAGDYIVEGAGQGIDDHVLTSVSYTLGGDAEIERFSAIDNGATSALSLTGNGFANRITGNAGNNILNGGGGTDTLFGLGGDDTYYVDNAADFVVEGASQGNDILFTSVNYALTSDAHVEVLSTIDHSGLAALSLTGNQFANTLYGNAGTNTLNGSGGADILIGFGGDDTYHVDNAGDQAVEHAGQGNDAVFASVSYVLGAESHVELLSTVNHSHTTAINLTGSGFANTLYGNAGSNVLDGGGGTDTLIGLGGDDDYYVDDASDIVVEAAGGGEDWVFVRGSGYTLGAGVHVELLAAAVLESTASLSLTGNELDQILIGNDGANMLNGAGGGDLMAGLNGDDIYIVDNSLDEVFEDADEGVDTIQAHVSYFLAPDAHIERLIAANPTGTSTIDFEGNAFSNTLVGNAGSNILIGGGGTDTLTGLGGADIFGFASTPGAQNVATITDFNAQDDDIALAGGIFSAIPTGQLSSNAFTVSSSGALDADDRIIYNSQTGALFYDADGSGSAAAQQFATLGPSLALSAANFFVFATNSVIVEQAGFNDTIGAAQGIARSAFVVTPNPDLPNANLPSVTIQGAISTASDRDYYSVSLQAGERITLDIDGTSNQLDTIVRVFNSAGVLVASNDDSGVMDAGSNTSLDSFLTYTASSGGTYYFSVESYGSGSSGLYDLNVSISAASSAAQAPAGGADERSGESAGLAQESSADREAGSFAWARERGAAGGERDTVALTAFNEAIRAIDEEQPLFPDQLESVSFVHAGLAAFEIESGRLNPDGEFHAASGRYYAPQIISDVSPMLEQVPLI
jgi:Ca2+-binding RTX toxin-like protein